MGGEFRARIFVWYEEAGARVEEKKREEEEQDQNPTREEKRGGSCQIGRAHV